MMLGTMLWAKRAELGDLAPYQSSIGKAAEDAFMNHLTCVKVSSLDCLLAILPCCVAIQRLMTSSIVAMWVSIYQYINCPYGGV